MVDINCPACGNHYLAANSINGTALEINNIEFDRQ